MRSKTAAARTRNDAAWIVAMSFALLILAAGSAFANYGPRGIADLLHSRGYYNIQIVGSDDGEYDVIACKEDGFYEMEIKGSGRIDDIDRRGSCEARHAGGYYPRDVRVSAPYADVDVDGRDVNVDAPFTDVEVDRDGVRVRAPFVDLNVPRR